LNLKIRHRAALSSKTPPSSTFAGCPRQIHSSFSMWKVLENIYNIYKINIKIHTNTIKMNKKTIKLNEIERSELYNLYYKNPMLRYCREILFSRVFQNNVTLIAPKRENFIVNEDFQEVLDKYYYPFAKSILDDYFVFGYSHYYLAKIRLKNKSILVPKQLPFGSYTVTMVTEPFKDTELIFKTISDTSNDFNLNELLLKSVNKRKKTVKTASSVLPNIYNIVFETQILPDNFTGKHRSIVSTVTKSFKYQASLMHFNLQAEYTRAFPKLFTKIKDNKSKDNQNDFDTSNIVDNELIQLKEKQRNNLKLQSINHAIDCQEPSRKYIRIDDERIDIVDITENIFQLPYDIDLASSSLPTASSRADLIDFEIQKNRLALSVFGIPGSFLIGKDVSLKNNAKMSEEEAKNFFKTVVRHAKTTEQALQSVFDFIYPNNSKVNADDNDEIADVKQYISIEVYNDTLKLDTIKILYENNVIDEVEKKRLMLLSAGLFI
jgi:hypothetical protein